MRKLILVAGTALALAQPAMAQTYTDCVMHDRCTDAQRIERDESDLEAYKDALQRICKAVRESYASERVQKECDDALAWFQLPP